MSSPSLVIRNGAVVDVANGDPQGADLAVTALPGRPIRGVG